VFGPVATFEIFDDEAEAITRANATDYGLAASIWTCDVDRPLRVGREIDAGTIWTNTWAMIFDQMEEGGFKQSGVGRLHGMRALEEFQEIKHFVHPSLTPSDRSRHRASLLLLLFRPITERKSTAFVVGLPKDQVAFASISSFFARE
jgi:hypothetical protein